MTIADAQACGSTKGPMRGFNIGLEFTAASTTAALAAELLASLVNEGLGIADPEFITEN